MMIETSAISVKQYLIRLIIRDLKFVFSDTEQQLVLHYHCTDTLTWTKMQILVLGIQDL